jgi:hypothetical protein
VKLFDNPPLNPLDNKKKLLEQMTIAVGGVVKKRYVRLKNKKEINLLSPFLEPNYEQDCAAHCILNIMKLSGYCDKHQNVKKIKRRDFVAKVYLRLVIKTFESGCLRHAFDKPHSEMEAMFSLETIPKMLSIFLDSFDSIILTQDSRRKCAVHKKPFINKKLQTDKTVLPLFEIVITCCCSRRFHPG